MKTKYAEINLPECPICNGDGFWYDDDAPDDGTEDFNRVPCDECGSLGYIHSEQ